MYPNGSRVLELSTKCDPAEAFMAAAETRAFSGRGIDLSGEQQMKDGEGARVLRGPISRKCGHPAPASRDPYARMRTMKMPKTPMFTSQLFANIQSRTVGIALFARSPSKR